MDNIDLISIIGGIIVFIVALILYYADKADYLQIQKIYIKEYLDETN
jgi:hypothetical protein